MLNSDKLTEQKLKTAVLRGTQLLTNNNLHGWTININNKRSYVATTWHNKKSIDLSKRFIAIASKEQFDGVMLHEITHAILGPGKGHGPEFVELYNTIGNGYEFNAPNSQIRLRRYIYTCSDCGYSGSSETKPNNPCCRKCSDDGKKVPLEMKINRITVNPW